jgi:hypothetical protein
VSTVEPRDHEHYPLFEHSFHDGRTQWDRPCRQPDCPGVARVQMAWAPDTGMNWLKCCCCGDKWNPGKVIYPPGIGEFLAHWNVGEQ